MTSYCSGFDGKRSGKRAWKSEGLGWHSRSFSDEYDVCYAADGAFVTLFHARKEEALEIIAKAFFNRRWDRLNTGSFKSLAASRFLAASIVSQAAEEAFTEFSIGALS